MKQYGMRTPIYYYKKIKRSKRSIPHLAMSISNQTFNRKSYYIVKLYIQLFMFKSLERFGAADRKIILNHQWVTVVKVKSGPFPDFFIPNVKWSFPEVIGSRELTKLFYFDACKIAPIGLSSIRTCFNLIIFYLK